MQCIQATVVLYYVILCYITLHYITLHYITLRYITLYFIYYGAKGDWNFVISDLVKNPDGTDIFSEVRRAQLAKSTLLRLYPGASGIFSDLLRSFQMLKATVSYRTYSSLMKLQSWFLSLRWKTCLRQNCSLGSCACSEGPALGQNTLKYIHFFWRTLYNLRGTGQ